MNISVRSLLSFVIFFIALNSVYAMNTCSSIFASHLSIPAISKYAEALNILDGKVADKKPDSSVIAAAQRLTEAFGKDYRVLALHPGITSRVDQFIKYTKEQNTILNSMEAFQRFKTHLGDVVLSRALRLTDEEVAHIKTHGLISNAQRNGLSQEEIFNLIATNGVAKLIKKHMHYEGARQSPFSSFTEVEAIAAWVTNIELNSSLNRYIYKVQIPVIDIIYIRASNNKFEEVVVFGNFAPTQILNLQTVKPYNSTYSTADIMEELRGSLWRSSDFLIPKEMWPSN